MAVKGRASEIFKEELVAIQNPFIAQMITDFFDKVVPDYFWDIPASSSGKYHPNFCLGEGGLVKHTKMAVAVAEELLSLRTYSQAEKSDVIAAVLIHDTFKNGDEDCGFTKKSHPKYAANHFREFANGYSTVSPVSKQAIYEAVLFHMGQWSTKEVEFTPISAGCSDTVECVKMADYIASRKFFDLLDNF